MPAQSASRIASTHRRWWSLALLMLVLAPVAWTSMSASSSDSALAASSCPLDPTQPTVEVGMTLEGCDVVVNAVSSVADPLSFWGAVDCEDPTRAQRPVAADDPAETALGGDQYGEDAYRHLTVYDGDDVWGERCELGEDDHDEGPTTFYHEGQHRVTYISLRLPSNFPLSTEKWQTVMAMRQTQPDHPTWDGVPVLFMGAFGNAWHIDSPNGEYWKFPAETNRWTRFAWDVYYSQDPSKGWLQVSADLNGDGDFNDPGERSPVIHTATLKTEAAGSFNATDGLAAGASIPSHLRVGINHDPSISCPYPTGCSIDLDNIQVIDAGSEEAVPPPPATPPPPSCPMGQTTSTTRLGMTLPGCKLLASDTASVASPLTFWGAVQCGTLAKVLPSRASLLASGGDPHAMVSGGTQPDSAFRRMTAFDGDDFYGERCELGENDSRTGPTVFYHEGQHRATYLSLRLPSNFPLNTSNWQTVMQMKQTQPSDDNCCGPELEMQATRGEWVIADSWNILWTFPAQTNKWTRFAWDVYYSQDPSKGWLQVSADLNGDGDFNDSDERSPVIHTATLRTEPEGPHGASDGLAAGAPIPSHLRVGIYHNSSIPCPSPTGCSVDVDNVQVVGP
jgi:hypothetical protein